MSMIQTRHTSSKSGHLLRAKKNLEQCLQPTYSKKCRSHVVLHVLVEQ